MRTFAATCLACLYKLTPTATVYVAWQPVASIDDTTWDTDGDGLSDFWELTNDFDPENADTDGDSLSDYWEAFHNTNPRLTDSDYDGLSDAEEVFHRMPSTRMTTRPASFGTAAGNRARLRFRHGTDHLG